MNVDTAQFVFSLKRQGLQPRTIAVLISHLQRLTDTCNELTLETYYTFIDSKIETLSHASINKYAQAVKKYCEFMGWEWGKQLQKLSEQPKKRYLLSDDEIMDFIAIDTPYSLFWKLLAFTGCRPGELREITNANVDPISKSITFEKTKTGTGRTVPLSVVIADDVINYASTKEGKLFQFTEMAYGKDFKKRLEILGIKKDVKPYSLRHSFVTRLLQSTDLFSVQDIVGHSDPKTTRQYYHGNLTILHKAIKTDTLIKQSLNKEEMFEHLVHDLDKIISTFVKDFSISTKKTGKSYELHIAIEEKKEDITNNDKKKTYSAINKNRH